MPDLVVIEIVLTFDEVLLLRAMLKDCAQAPIHSQPARATAMQVIRHIDETVDQEPAL